MGGASIAKLIKAQSKTSAVSVNYNTKFNKALQLRSQWKKGIGTT